MRIFIIDGNALCYRSIFTVGTFSYCGKFTGVVYGFFKDLLPILQKYKPDLVACVWDSRESKRKEIYPSYKHSRKDKTKLQTSEEKRFIDSCFSQFIELREKILPKIGLINNFMIDGYEGDDLVASIIYSNGQDKHNYTIISSDNDLYQLLSVNTALYDLRLKQEYNKQHFCDEYGIEPEEWIHIKAIAGCSGDNVDGIEGVGIKTAIKFWNKAIINKETSTYKKIISPEGKSIYKRNLALVTLPFKNTPKIKLDFNQKINFVELRLIFLDRGLNSMVNKMSDWKELLIK